MVTKTFKRHELKYFVTPAQYGTLADILAARMTPDGYCKKNGSYMIYNLYFDTDDDEIIRRSLEKPYYKEKLRMRSLYHALKRRRHRLPGAEEENRRRGGKAPGLS